MNLSSPVNFLLLFFFLSLLYSIYLPVILPFSFSKSSCSTDFCREFYYSFFIVFRSVCALPKFLKNAQQIDPDITVHAFVHNVCMHVHTHARTHTHTSIKSIVMNCSYFVIGLTNKLQSKYSLIYEAEKLIEENYSYSK